MLLSHHREERERKGSYPRKYTRPVSFGTKLDLSEVHALAKISNRLGRPRTDLLRGLTLVLLETQGLYEPPDDPDEAGHDGALFEMARELLGMNDEPEEEEDSDE